jgi:hypothetical protein
LWFGGEDVHVVFFVNKVKDGSLSGEEADVSFEVILEVDAGDFAILAEEFDERVPEGHCWVAGFWETGNSVLPEGHVVRAVDGWVVGDITH